MKNELIAEWERLRMEYGLTNPTQAGSFVATDPVDSQLIEAEAEGSRPQN